MKIEEKILILGSLLHDVGKFQQRCESKRLGNHESLGYRFIELLQDSFLPILENDHDALKRLKEIVRDHHQNSYDNLVELCRKGDWLSASERVELAENEEPKDFWQHHFLSSLFSKTRLLNEEPLNLRYYKHNLLTRKDYNAIIPEYETKEDALETSVHYRNQQNIFSLFTEDFRAVLSIYESDNDFNTLVRLILILLEKYMWCIPDFTGNKDTDISLYNHLKDVSAISHSLYLNHTEDNKNNKLALIIGDIPGIQNYIFNIVNKKPAKILRGRSIYVQILTRIFSNIFLRNFALTEVNIIMLAGGKFYILAPFKSDFRENYQKSISEVEDFLAKNFFYDIKFAAGYSDFNYDTLKNKAINFGEIIDEASHNLLTGRNKLFKNRFINDENFKFVLNTEYIENNANESDNIKCAFTDRPIRKGFMKHISLEDGEPEIQVERQVYNEYKIGSFAALSTVVFELDEDFSFKEAKKLRDYNSNGGKYKIIINPSLDEMLKYAKDKKGLLKNADFIDVANYVSTSDEKVMDFNEMIKKNNGAEVLTLIKADIDELGLIMSTGLTGDKDANLQDYTAISRTTTLSNHLKYFFSLFINGFLEQWDNSGKNKSDEKNDQYVYTIFAGGDDLMLITPQSSSLKLLNELNKKFKDFVCDNPEVHISYSLTNFKDNTPIRIVADIAEENQKKIKKFFANKKRNSFIEENNKSGVMLFDTPVKNNSIARIMLYKKEIEKFQAEGYLSNSTLYALFNIASLLKEFFFEKNKILKTKNLITHPMLTYVINRNIKGRSGRYKTPELEDFFKKALSLPNKNFEDDMFLISLYPLLCSVIYKLRNK